jgi:tetratricopeptide (TPR) repeat protein
MPLPTVQVFVSSTWLDLVREREAAEAALQRLRETKYVGMEFFGSRDETTRRASLEEVDRSLVYVGLFGARYGSGITEAEYRRAREKGLPCFIYFKSDATVADDARETDPAQTSKLEALKDELRRGHAVTTFDNPDDLAARVTADLHRWLFDKYLPDLPAPLIPTLHQLRAPVGDFVGREKEIEELLSTLRGGGSAAITGISGMGGIGKTELSFHVAERLRDTYPDAQLVLDMRGTDDPPRDPSDALATCIRAFHGLEQRLPDDTEELTSLYRSTLEGKRTLILLDNAHDSAQVRPLLPPTGSALLITSRNVVTLPGMRTRITLDQLHPNEARELLTGIAPRVPEEIADRICFLCGYLPLAIRAAGSLLDVTADLDPSGYAAQLRDERTRLERIGAEGVDISVGASFNLSYARLSPQAARVFRRLSVFPASFDAKAEEAVCEDDGHKHLTDLLRRNLVIYNTDTRRYRLHDLARLFAVSRLSAAERDSSEKRHAEHYLSALEETDSLFSQGGEALKRGLALFDLELRNTQAGQSWAENNIGKDRRTASLYGKYLDIGATLFHMRLHPREYIDRLEVGLAVARQLEDRHLEVQMLNDLGWAFRDLGDNRSATEFYERALELSKETGDSAAEGVVLNNLSGVYLTVGKTRRALKHMKRVLAIMREEGFRREEGMALLRLGHAYEALGEVRRALELYEQSLVIAREIGDLVGEGNALHGVGGAHRRLGDLRRAVEAHERALAITRDINDRRGEGDSLCALGADYYHLGDVRRAVELFERSLDIAREFEDREAEGTALGNLGGAYVTLGENRRAIEFHEQCLSVARQIGDKTRQGQALSNLGLTYRNLREYGRAVKFYEEALKISRRIGDRREEGEVLSGLGTVYDAMGERPRALDLYQRQLGIARETGNRKGEGAALWNVSLVFYGQGKLTQAIEHAEEALRIREEIQDSRGAKVRTTLARWRREATKGE